MDTPQKGDALVNTGWGLVALTWVLFAGGLSIEHKRDGSIDAVLSGGTALDFSCMLVYLVGLHMFAVLAAIMGTYAARICGNLRGNRLLKGCLLVIAVSSARQFMPSDSAGKDYAVQTFEAKQPGCEFAVTFPHRIRPKARHICITSL
jgi:hypothetical protein